MANLINEIINKAKQNVKTIVLAEGTEPRVQRAAIAIQHGGIANIILLGDKEAITEALAEAADIGIQIIDPKTSDLSESFAEKLYELRKAKGLTLEQADQLIRNDVLFFGAMLVKQGIADGMVAGAINSTGNVLRSGLQVIKTKPGINTVSSVFIMMLPDYSPMENKLYLFGDCAVNPEPTSQQLAEIAYSSASTAKVLAGIEQPRIAMLSYSTRGSGKGPLVKKVQEATEILKTMIEEEVLVDGEIQVDAALVPKVQRLKAPMSAIEGKANVLIFPDLQSGNIGYKLVERLGGATAIGPICQGFAKPINDLSRGCSEDDIIAVVAITSLQSQE